MSKYVDLKYLDRVAKRLEKSNLKKYHKSLTWGSISNHLYACIIDVYDNSCMLIDDKKLKELKADMVEKVVEDEQG